MKPTLVYRVEHKVIGLGPYYTIWESNLPYRVKQRIKEIVDKNLFIESTHPDPDGDFCEKDYFGFKTLKQFNKWFSYDVCKALKKCGFVLSVYRCSTVKTLNKQCTFDKNKAKLIERIDLTKPKLHG